MGTILNGKYLSMPEQVQKNKNDIQVITEYLENIYKCSSALEESSTSINIEYTNIGDKRDFLFAFLLDNKGLLFKIIDIIGDIVYLEFYSKLPSVDFNYLGEWVAGNNEYHPNDVVLYNGSLYICENTILDSSVTPPQDTTNWSLFLGFGESIGNFIISEYNKQLNDNPIIHKKDLGTLLWENANPSTTFDPQTINLDLTTYTCVLCIFKDWSDATSYSRAECNIGYGINVIGNPSAYNNELTIDFRRFTVTTGGVNFENNFTFTSSGEETIRNNNIIPFQIWGIK